LCCGGGAAAVGIASQQIAHLFNSNNRVIITIQALGFPVTDGIPQLVFNIKINVQPLLRREWKFRVQLIVHLHQAEYRLDEIRAVTLRVKDRLGKIVFLGLLELRWVAEPLDGPQLGAFLHSVDKNAESLGSGLPKLRVGRQGE